MQLKGTFVVFSLYPHALLGKTCPRPIYRFTALAHSYPRLALLILGVGAPLEPAQLVQAILESGRGTTPSP